MFACRKVLTVLMILLSLKSGVKTQCVQNGSKVSCERIKQITPGFLSTIYENVTSIEINNRNEISEVAARTFKSIKNLERLTIRWSRIKKIYGETVRDLPNLKYLFLNYNGITEIYTPAFLNLPKLQKVYLSYNNLTVVRKGIFRNVTQLESIILSHNNINHFEDESFQEVTNLKKLTLDHNKLETIFLHDILSHPEKLETLWLHNNSLTFITNYMLQKLTNLKILNIGFNQISVIESGSFQHTPNLNTLVLTHNKLKDIDGDIFPRSGMDFLKNLYLDHNRLMYLTSKFFVRSSGLRKITLMGNPWFCQCLKEIYSVLNENGIEEKCQGPFSKGQRPVCVNGDVLDSCRHTYNAQLSAKFLKYMKDFPVYVHALDCHL